MTDLRTAAQQALEALDGVEALLTSMDVTHLLVYEEVNNAITALRAALAEPVQEPWEHLKQYGYAPGSYMSRCHACDKIASGVDKRAITCRPCAEARHATLAEPAFHGFMSADGTRVDLCFTPGAPRADGVYATAYYTAPPQPPAQPAQPVQEPADIPLEDALSNAYYYTEEGKWRGAEAREWDRWHAVAKVAVALTQKQAEPVEPVARVRVNSNVPGRINELDLLRPLPRGEHFLYTAPRQRKPLTDEELERLWYPNAVIAEPGKRRVAFGRAIERAHGIGVQP